LTLSVDEKKVTLSLGVSSLFGKRAVSHDVARPLCFLFIFRPRCSSDPLASFHLLNASGKSLNFFTNSIIERAQPECGSLFDLALYNIDAFLPLFEKLTSSFFQLGILVYIGNCNL